MLWHRPLRQDLDPDLTEPDGLAFGLPADCSFRGLGLFSFGDLNSVEDAGDRPALAGDLHLVPLADGLDGGFLGNRVALGQALRVADGEDAPGSACESWTSTLLGQTLWGRVIWRRRPLLPRKSASDLSPS